MRCTYTTLCNKVSQWLATGRSFSSGTPVSSTNKTDRHNIADIFLKVAFNTITLTIKVDYCFPIISSTDHIRVDNVRHTSGYFFYRKLYNGGNFSTIWQNKTHFFYYFNNDPVWWKTDQSTLRTGMIIFTSIIFKNLLSFVYSFRQHFPLFFLDYLS